MKDFTNIEQAHDAILEYLLLLRKNTGQSFAPRKINNKGRLDRGLWFIGDDDYLLVSFWDGSDTKEKVHAISFGYSISEGESWIEMSSKDNAERAEFLESVASGIGGFDQVGSKQKWRRSFKSKSTIENLDFFVKNYLPVIDDAVAMYEGQGLKKLDETFDDKYVSKIIERRNSKNRIARLCWNENMWQRPSGSVGKSKDKNTYENKNGYGFEEWLFDKSLLIDGYHYGYIRAASKDGYENKTFNIGLYAKNSEDGLRYWLGVIANVEVLDADKKLLALNTYKANGWLDEMERDLENLGVKSANEFTDESNIFNVRFFVEDMNILDQPVVKNEAINKIASERYSLLLKTDLEFTKQEIDVDSIFTFQPGHNIRSEESSKKKGVRATSVSKRHNRYQSKIYFQLCEEYGDKNVGTEQRIDNRDNTSVDIAVRLNSNEYIFYEIKTDSRIKYNIRQALGQLLEYAHWNKQLLVKKMVVVSPVKPDFQAKKYMELLRENYGLGIYYQFYDPEKGILAPIEY